MMRDLTFKTVALATLFSILLGACGLTATPVPTPTPTALPDTPTPPEAVPAVVVQRT
nr:hypothetical protein [Anaerolineae bacterium]